MKTDGAQNPSELYEAAVKSLERRSKAREITRSMNNTNNHFGAIFNSVCNELNILEETIQSWNILFKWLDENPKDKSLPITTRECIKTIYELQEDRALTDMYSKVLSKLVTLKGQDTPIIAGMLPQPPRISIA